MSTITGKSIATLIIFFLSIIFVIHAVEIRLPFFRRSPAIRLNLTTAPIIAIAILWASQCLGPTQIRDGIVGVENVKPYNILILFFSLAYMAITLDITGILQSAAFWVSNKGGSNGYKLFFYFYVMLTTLSVVLGNDPVILSGTAFLVYYTKVAELNPMAWLMAEFAAANTASMVLFVGNPTNVVICEGFLINNAAFTAYTILPFLGCIVACFIALAIQFRNPKYVPKRLANTQQLDVRSVLLDPFGALVGSILLGLCLVVIIVVSFFHVDVWKISLPFAGAKFLFDLGWDHYRHTKGDGSSSVDSDEPKPVQRAQTAEDIMLQQLERKISPISPRRRQPSLPPVDRADTADTQLATGMQNSITQGMEDSTKGLLPQPVSRVQSPDEHPVKTHLGKLRSRWITIHTRLSQHFPTLFTALPRLPFALVPFAFSQFILIEALSHQGWIDVFASWLSIASGKRVYPTIWLIGVLGTIMCNISGTNIGATILLTKVINNAPGFDHNTKLAGAIALAVASNIGAVSFTFSASLAGLLWQGILRQKGIIIKQKSFAFWNMLPLAAMTAVGLAVVCAEMAVLFR
jgi:Na+/H+ antiporter NhaD/arsenite permease-like protein